MENATAWEVTPGDTKTKVIQNMMTATVTRYFPVLMSPRVCDTSAKLKRCNEHQNKFLAVMQIQESLQMKLIYSEFSLFIRQLHARTSRSNRGTSMKMYPIAR